MNTFKRGDKVKCDGVERVVSSTHGRLVYVEGGLYGVDCSRVAFALSPKFLPGDVVTNSNGNEGTLKCVKTNYSDGGGPYNGRTAYEYVGGGWDREENLTLVKRPKSVRDYIREGKMIDAIKQHRVLTGLGLKEAKDACEAMRADMNHNAAAYCKEETLGDILGKALAKPTFKPGDLVECISNKGSSNFTVGLTYKVTGVDMGGHGSNGPLVTCIGDNGRDGTGQYASRWKLATVKPKFKIGDKIYTADDKNDIGTVTSINNGRYAVSFPSVSCNSSFHIWDEKELFPFVPSAPAIVARKYGNVYRPSNTPMVHATRADADKEAQRLAVKHPGETFGTFVLASYSLAPVPVPVVPAAVAKTVAV